MAAPSREVPFNVTLDAGSKLGTSVVTFVDTVGATVVILGAGTLGRAVVDCIVVSSTVVSASIVVEVVGLVVEEVLAAVEDVLAAVEDALAAVEDVPAAVVVSTGETETVEMGLAAIDAGDVVVVVVVVVVVELTVGVETVDSSTTSRPGDVTVSPLSLLSVCGGSVSVTSSSNEVVVTSTSNSVTGSSVPKGISVASGVISVDSGTSTLLT